MSELMLADAARVAGVDFTEEERRQMVAAVNKNLKNYEKTRAVKLPFTVAPPLYFNPVVPGASPVSARRPFRPSAAPRVFRRDRVAVSDIVQVWLDADVITLPRP